MGSHVVALVSTVAYLGLEAREVEVQCQLAPGMPRFAVVGLPDKAVGESRERVQSALSSMGLALPPKRITINLSPAYLPKEGSHYDLPIALALLAAMGVTDAEQLADFVAVGELALDGRIVASPGVLLAALPFASFDIAQPGWIVAFALIGGAFLASLGVIAGIWADKFDQLAAFQNFLIMPLTMLSGVFYSIHSLPAFWQGVSHFNPFFFMIDGFRYGFFGVSDVSPWTSIGVVLTCFIVLAVVTLQMLARGYKLRA